MAITRITKGVIKPNENYDTHNINSTGIVTAIGLDINGNADVSGSLSVGGVLTYEDVTSIDSVGIITARTGLVSPYADIDDFVSVGNNIHLGNAGVITATSFAGDGSGLIGVASTDNIVTGTAATFNIYPVDINAGMTVAGVSTMAAITATTGTFSGAIDLNADLDVDGHTNLDNVSVAGISSFAGIIDANNTPASIRVAQDIQHKGDADTKITFPAADQISFETAGTNRLKIHNYDSNHNVEVDASAHLSLANNGSNGRFIYIGDANASSTGYMHLQPGGGSQGFGGGIRLYSHSNSTNAGGVYIGKSHASSGAIIFGNGGMSPLNEYLRINASGHVVPGLDSTYDLGLTGTRFRNVYADTLYGDGSNLTGLSGVSVANQSDNRLVTATGTTDALNAEANLTFDGSTLTLPAVSGANTNSDLPVLFQTSSGAIEGGSGLTYNPAQDVLSVNGNHISRQVFRGDGALGMLTCDNHSSTTSVNVSNTVDITTVDNTTDAFTLKQGSNEYITVDTNNSSELITLGNATTNPTTKIISDKQILVLQGVDTSGSTDMKHGSESGGGDSNSIYIPKANSTFDWRGGMVMRGTGGTWGLRISASGSMGTSSDTIGEIFGVHPAEPTNPTNAQSARSDAVDDAYFRVMGNAKIFATVPIYQSGSRPFYFNSTAVTSNETITTSYNAMSVGDIQINSGNTVTVQSGARWVIV